MPRRRDHMLEALRASIGESSKPIRVKENPALQRGAGGDLGRESLEGSTAPPKSSGPAESLGGIVPPDFRRVTAPSVPAPHSPVKPAPQQRQVVLPMGLGTVVFVGLFLLTVAFGFGWLLAGGANPFDQNTAAGASVTSAGIGNQGNLVPQGDAAAPPAMRTDFAAFEDPRPLAVQRSAPLVTTQEADALASSTDPDRALLDPANHYTVQVVEYADQRDTFQKYARATYDTLIKAGLPVVQPLLTNGKILLVVGAGKTASELSSLMERLRQVPDPRGSGRLLPDPYVVPIHRVLP